MSVRESERNKSQTRKARIKKSSLRFGGKEDGEDGGGRERRGVMMKQEVKWQPLLMRERENRLHIDSKQ